MLNFWITVIVSGLCLPAFAQVYKWVDEKGVTQYGQKPPADNKGQKMNMPNTVTAPAVGGASSQKAGAAVKEQELEFRRRQIAREETEQKDIKQEEARKHWCINAADDLERKRHARIYDLNAKGERIYKNDADRDAFIARSEATYKQHCQ